MANVGPLELVLVLVIALVVLGPKKLPEAGRSLGKGIREFKSSLSGEHEEDRRDSQVSTIAEPPGSADETPS